MASNIADIWLVFPSQGDAGTALTEIDFTAAAVKAQHPIPSRCQVKEWGVIITTVFVEFTVKPVIKLSRRPLITGTAVVIQTLSLGDTNTTLRKYTTNPDVVAAGGPGTVVVGPAIGGHTSAIVTDAASFTVGTVILADTKSLPSAMLQPGDVLQAEVSTAGTVGSGKGIVFVRLEVAAEQYTTALVQYDAIP